MLFRLFIICCFAELRGGASNSVDLNDCFLYRCKIEIKGDNNKICFKGISKFKYCKFIINGSDNRIVIDEKNVCSGLNVWIEDNENSCLVGRHNCFMGEDSLILTEGKKIIIQDNCLFSHDVTLRTGDSHSIFDSQGKRINRADDIMIASHVWVGNKVTILKGTSLGENCVVGTGAICTGGDFSNSVLCGVPARVTKSDITWDESRTN